MNNELKSVELNDKYQIRFSLIGKKDEYIVDFKAYLCYIAYAELSQVALFLSAKFDSDIIFWDLDIDIHIDQLLEMSKPYREDIANKHHWRKLKKTSYYQYTLNNWSFA